MHQRCVPSSCTGASINTSSLDVLDEKRSKWGRTNRRRQLLFVLTFGRQQNLMSVQPGKMLQGSPKKSDSRIAIVSTRLV